MNVRRGLVLVLVASWVVAACGTDAAEDKGDPGADTVTSMEATPVESPGVAAPEPTTPEPTTPDKSGGTPSSTLTITLANENDEAAGEAAGVEEFARQVELLSEGTMRVDVRWHARETDDIYTVVTEAVRKGSVDMAFVGNNYWGYEDVTSTQAAQTPLLVRSFAQGVAVAEDPELVEDLFSGLDEIGVVGLALFPEDFKVLVDFEGAVTSPEDLDGRVLQARAAPELYSFFEALGAEPQQEPASGQPQLRVVPPWLQREFPQGTLVGNLPIYFVYFDLVANKEFWNNLGDDQRQVIVEAAAAAQDLVVDQQTEQQSLDFVAEYCERGSAVNALDDAVVERFEAAAQPTIDELGADPLTAELMARIDQLGNGESSTVYPLCERERGPDLGLLPNGVYRFEVTDDDLRAAAIDQDEWSADTGIYTFTINDGLFTWTQQSDSGTSIDPNQGAFLGGGTYQVDGNHLATTETQLDPTQPITTELTWAADADGTLTFQIVNATRDFARFLYGEPWLRIGDA